ncbi:MAG: T9SS type A sorting domain-containing protein [Bacteroidia bacterium]
MYRQHSRLILVISFMLGLYPTALHAQFWRQYPSGGAFDGQQTTDGGFIMIGTNNYFPGGGAAYLIKTDYRGDTLWTQGYNLLGSLETGMRVKQTSDGGYLVMGERKPLATPHIYYMKTDASGNLLWDKTMTDPFSQAGDFVEVNGGYALAGTVIGSGNNMDYYLIRIDDLGDTLWVKEYDWGGIDRCGRILQTGDGGFLLGGNVQANVNTLPHSVLLKVDSLGTVQWQATYNFTGAEVQLSDIYKLSGGGYLAAGALIDSLTGASTGYLQWYNISGQLTQTHFFSNSLLRSVRRVIELPGGDLLVAAYVFNPGSAADILLLRTTANGNVIWSKTYGSVAVNENEAAHAIGTTASGGYYIVGRLSILDQFLLIVTDSLGNTATNILRGNYFEDTNFNCLMDAGESPYGTIPFIIQAQNLSTNALFYASTGDSGKYEFLLPLGDYQLTPLSHPYLNYSSCLPLPVTSFTQTAQLAQVNVPFEVTYNCPLNYVDVSAPAFIIGDSCQITVQACNNGTSDSYPTLVQVELDSFLTYGGASYPLLSQVGQIFTFVLDTLIAGECKTIQIHTWLDSVVVPGQTHCVEAQIWPDTFCTNLAAWTGPQIQAEITCLGDTIRFDLTNVGEAMQAAHNYTIYIDDVIFVMGSFQLGSGGSQSLFEPATPGASYRIEAEQDTAFPPSLGDPQAIAFAEGCLPYPGGGFETGWITAFYNGNVAPSIDILCRQNGASYDPNDKLALPVGYDTAHYIYDNTPLSYMIRFQNTGTAPAQRVVIVDTLPPALDPLTIEPGGSSHAYTWRVDDQGVLRFTFNPIFLPDSTTDEEGSQGYVQFRIRQKPGNLPGTRIENRAAIYFDYNVPVITASVFHTVGEDFVRIEIVSTGIEKIEGDNVKVWPNPTGGQVHFSLEGGSQFRLLTCEIFNLLGQPVMFEAAQGTSVLTLNLANLPEGLYGYRLVGDGKVLDSGLVKKQN